MGISSDCWIVIGLLIGSTLAYLAGRNLHRVPPVEPLEPGEMFPPRN
jgi:hypothetical protein